MKMASAQAVQRFTRIEDWDYQLAQVVEFAAGSYIKDASVIESTQAMTVLRLRVRPVLAMEAMPLPFVTPERVSLRPLLKVTVTAAPATGAPVLSRTVTCAVALESPLP